MPSGVTLASPRICPRQMILAMKVAAILDQCKAGDLNTLRKKCQLRMMGILTVMSCAGGDSAVMEVKKEMMYDLMDEAMLG